MITQEDTDQLVADIKKIATPASDKRVQRFLTDVSDIEKSQLPAITIYNQLINKLEETFLKALKDFRDKPSFLMRMPNYFSELTRGGGKQFDREVGLLLKKAYKNPDTFSSGNIHYLVEVKELKEKPSLKQQLENAVQKGLNRIKLNRKP